MKIGDVARVINPESGWFGAGGTIISESFIAPNGKEVIWVEMQVPSIVAKDLSDRLPQMFKLDEIEVDEDR